MDDRIKEENKGILYAVMVTFLFLLLLLLIAGGIFLFQTKGDFYSALKGELHRAFLLPALFLLFFSSILYTPFSYGISYYFYLSQKSAARFSTLFFLFKDLPLLLKAVLLSVYKKILIYLEGLAILLAAALLEVALFFSFLLVTGEDLFEVKGDLFQKAAEFMLRSPALIFLSVLLWSGVLLGFLLIRLRYFLCKYVLLCYPEASAGQAIKVGRIAIRKQMLYLIFFYLRSAGLYLLYILSFGKMRRFKEREPFSFYAYGLARKGWRKYCGKRSMRNH